MARLFYCSCKVDRHAASVFSTSFDPIEGRTRIASSLQIIGVVMQDGPVAVAAEDEAPCRASAPIRRNPQRHQWRRLCTLASPRLPATWVEIRSARRD